MIIRGSALLGKRRAAVALGAAIVVAGSVVGVAVAAASPSSQPSASGVVVTTPHGPKSAQPMNINPDKSPVLTPPAPAAVERGPVLSIADQEAAAEREVAKNPGSALVCFLPDGSVAGVAVVDKVHPTDPISDSVGICARGWKGSRP